MSRNLFFLSLLILVGSCNARKIIEKEQCLMLSSSKNKIYIISCFPADPNTKGFYISTMLTSNNTASQQQITLLLNGRDEENQKLITTLYNDSVEVYDTSSFPLLIRSNDKDSLNLHFNFTLDRNQTKLETGTVNYQLTYMKNSHFKIDSIGTNFEINRVWTNDATLKQLNETETDQSIFYTIHTIDNSIPIFTSSKFYWLDFQLNNKIHALFIEEKIDGTTELIYSTIAGNVQLNDQSKQADQQSISINPIIQISLLDNSVVEIYSNEPISELSKLSYQVNTLLIKQENITVGNGIIYILGK
jgi:hypothetical protein